MYPAIEDHGIIGNLRTAALVSTDGIMDFFCPLRFDNPTLFASLLDGEKGGYCSIRPLASNYRRKQLYLPDTNVLITRFFAPDGIAEITDFMPLGTELQQSVIVRRIAVTRGQVALRFECVPAFNYASQDHEAVSVPEGVVFYGKNSDALSIQSESCIRVRDGCAVSDLHLKAEQQVTFILTYSREPSSAQVVARCRRDAHAGHDPVLARLGRRVQLSWPLARDGDSLGARPKAAYL